MDEVHSPASGWRLLLSGGLLLLLAGALVVGALWLSAMDRALAPPRSPTPTPEVAWLPTLFIPTVPALSPTPVVIVMETPPSPAPSPTEGPTPTPPSVLYPTCTPPAGWRPYRVQAGDALYHLAWRAGTSPLLIQQANCLVGERLTVGQILHLPPQFFAPPTRVPCGPSPGWVRYIVQPGDTLWNLSLRLGVSVEAIRWANCMTDYIIRVGQPLYLPAYPPPLSPTPTRFPTVTRTPTPSPTGTRTPTPTVTPTPTGTPTPTESPTPTGTPTPTESPTPTENANGDSALSDTDASPVSGAILDSKDGPPVLHRRRERADTPEPQCTSDHCTNPPSTNLPTTDLPTTNPPTTSGR